MIGGAAVAYWGMTSDMCKWGEESDCNATLDSRLLSIGLLAGVAGGGLGLGLGIPLWVKGAARENGTVGQRPTIHVTPRRIAAVWRF